MSNQPFPPRKTWLNPGCLLATFAALLLGITLHAQTTVTTLGGGQPSKFYGYRDGDTLHSALFHTPCGLAIDTSGTYLFVADRDNNSIRYLDLSTSFTWTFMTNQISKPVGVLLDNSLDVYALNQGNGKNGNILSFDNFGDLLATNVSGLTNACAMTMDLTGNIYVTVQSNTVIKVTPAGVKSTVTTIPIAGTFLQGIVSKHNGLLAVCDSGRNGIYLIDPTTGIFTTNSGFHGAGDFLTNSSDISSEAQSKFNQPTGIAEAGDGTLIVSDYNNNRVKVVLLNGAVTNLYGVTRQFWGGTYKGWYDGVPQIPDSIAPNVQSREPFGVAFGPDGTVYTSEDYYHTIRQVTGAGFVLPPPPPPAPPLYVTASATFGQVTLSWTASTGATNYNVKRSYQYAGPYTIQGNTSTLGFVDTTVANGVTYYYVVSALNAGGESSNSLPVTITTPVPPVTDPQIGFVTFPASSTPVEYTSVFSTAGFPSYIFNNVVPLVIIGEPGTQTFYTAGATDLTAGPTNGVADPTANGSSVPSGYINGLDPEQVTTYTVAQVMPDMTIRAIGEKNDGMTPNSDIVQARFQFVTANPNIIGNNAAQFMISDATTDAHLYYTLDGSDPSPTNGIDLGTVFSTTNLWTVGFPISSNTLFKVRGFLANFQPSGIVSNLFSATNFVANQISFGFASGEASSSFIASPGQTFYAPVTLTTLPNTSMYSLQFNLTVTNAGPNPGPPVAPNSYGFQSMLVKPVPNEPGVFEQIPPYMFENYAQNPPPPSSIITYDGISFISLMTTNSAENLVTVGWLERAGETNLYNTISQDLIQYSQAHDVVFLQANNAIEVGGYNFVVPPTATAGQTYEIQIGRPSATSDGVGAPNSEVYISSPTNGSFVGGQINGAKFVTVGQIKYVVGDVYPFNWFNAGDFGQGYLNNNDVEQVFQSAIYGLDTPPAGSDFFDAMDSCGNLGTLDGQTGYYTNNNTVLTVNQQNALFSGNDTTINQIAFGDGELDVCDVYVTFRRSEDPSLTWFSRFWTNGIRAAITVPNQVPGDHALAAKAGALVQPKIQSLATTNSPRVNFAAGDILATNGQTVQIPITGNVFGAYPLRLLMLNLTVEPLDGSPALTTPIQFTANPALNPANGGIPDVTGSSGNNNFSGAWLTNGPGLTGNAILGTLTVTIPTTATSLSAYAVHFDHASASPNGLGSFPKQTLTGLITLSSRNTSSYNDGIPDSWRLRYFGTVNNFLSVSNADADGDGYSNWQEYVAGTDPTDPTSYLYVAANPVASGQPNSVQWPSVAGKQYAIQRSATLFSPTWTPVTTVTGTGATMQFNDTVTGQAYFYRIQVQ